MPKEKKKKEKKITGYSLMEQLDEPELAQFVPPDKNMTERRCEKCQYYLRIDDGYGYCRRFPPRNEIVGIIRKKRKIEYLIVEWNRKACGEFIKEN